MVFAAVGGCGEVFPPVLQPLERMPELYGCPGQADFFGQENSLITERAANIGRNYSYAGVFDA